MLFIVSHQPQSHMILWSAPFGNVRIHYKNAWPSKSLYTIISCSASTSTCSQLVCVYTCALCESLWLALRSHWNVLPNSQGNIPLGTYTQVRTFVRIVAHLHAQYHAHRHNTHSYTYTCIYSVHVFIIIHIYTHMWTCPDIHTEQCQAMRHTTWWYIRPVM